jgi:cell division protein FtsB
MPMTRVLQHIIRHAVNNKFGEEEVVSLKQYLEEYKQQYESIKREITNLGL